MPSTHVQWSFNVSCDFDVASMQGDSGSIEAHHEDPRPAMIPFLGTCKALLYAFLMNMSRLKPSRRAASCGLMCAWPIGKLKLVLNVLHVSNPHWLLELLSLAFAVYASRLTFTPMFPCLMIYVHACCSVSIAIACFASAPRAAQCKPVCDLSSAVVTAVMM